MANKLCSTREILFRGKRTDNGGWVEGYYYKMNETTYAFAEDYERNPVPTHHYILFEQMTDWGLPNQLYQTEVGEETICQYTGLTDKNGRKIFEGDICKTHYANAKSNEFVETIVFNGGRFCAYQDKDGCKSWAGLYDGVPHLAIDKSVYMDEIEVIGNIFDNPELIEQGDDTE